MVEGATQNICQLGHNYDYYCKKCNILCCGICAIAHMDHIESFVDWKMYRDEYHNKYKNILLHSNIMIQSTQSEDQLKAELYAKIDVAFDALVDKIRQFQVIYKTETWEKYGRGIRYYNSGGSKSANESIKKISINLQNIITQFKDLEESSTEKEKLLEFIKKNDIEKFTQEMKDVQREKVSELNCIRGITEMKISADLNYSKLLNLFKQSELIEESKVKEIEDLGDFLWNNKSKIITKLDQDQSHFTYSVSKPLPDSFEIKLKIIEDKGRSGFIAVGIVKIPINEKRRYIGFENIPNEWGYANNGNINNNNAGITTIDTYSKGDHIIISYNTQIKQLSFHKQGGQKSRIFENATRPFYLATTMHSVGMSIEIVYVK